MLRTRVIPMLLLRGENLLKMVRFGRFTYVGDPCNTVRNFNELEVDELCVLDVTAPREGCDPNLPLLADMANECFMSLSCGGSIRNFDQADAVPKIGIERVILNTGAVERPEVATRIANHFARQAVEVSIDAGHDLLGHRRVRTHGGTRSLPRDVVDGALRAEQLSVGEILLTSIAREGTWQGFAVHLVRSATQAVSVPVIAHGGTGSLQHVRTVVHEDGVSAVALGSMVVFQKRGMGVLPDFPNPAELAQALAGQETVR